MNFFLHLLLNIFTYSNHTRARIKSEHDFSLFFISVVNTRIQIHSLTLQKYYSKS